MLDSGVDYTHADLRENMWIGPANVPAYTDDELGTFNDLNGYNGTRQDSRPDGRQRPRHALRRHHRRRGRQRRRHHGHQLEGQDHAAQVSRPRRFWLDQRRDRGDQLRDRPQEKRRQRSRHQRKLGLDVEVESSRRHDPCRRRRGNSVCRRRRQRRHRTTTAARIIRRITICQT